MKLVKTKWVIGLPDVVKVLVRKGQMVKAGEKIAEAELFEERYLNIGNVKVVYLEGLIGKAVKKGETIITLGKLFKKKVLSPYEGEIVRTDEYSNIYIKTGDKKVVHIFSPTEAVVSEVEKEIISLEFKAVEYVGEGLSEGRAWGDKGLKIIEGLGDLSANDKDKVILMDEISTVLLSKAEVVGVSGVITKKSDKINSRLPILRIDTSDYLQILTEVDKTKRVMVNAGSGRLLLIV